MSAETLENVPGPPWYSKVFEYLVNRNRVGPGLVEMPDCDFFIVKPRRTIRILRPSPKGTGFYASNDQDGTIKENFNSRWAKRPHSSSNCRCSFRQSSRLKNNNERTPELTTNNIISQSEKIDQNIEKFETKISNLAATVNSQPINKNVNNRKIIGMDKNVMSIGEQDAESQAVKNKIVKDLEKYIDVLLGEVLNDTMKFIGDNDKALRKNKAALQSRKTNSKSIEESKIEQNNHSKSPLDISFAFPAKELDAHIENDLNIKGYINEGFEGTIVDPDCLNFDLRRFISSENEQIDCVDSGINSVETVEFQSQPELSLEESLMQIIDEKFGRGPLENWEDDAIIQEEQMKKIDLEVSSKKEVIRFENENTHLDICETNEIADVRGNESAIDSELEESIVENQFHDLRLGFKDDSNLSKTKDEPTKKPTAVAVFYERFATKLSTGCSGRENKIKEKSDKNKLKYEAEEMQDYCWKDCESEAINEDPSKDLVVLRRCRKPVIVFIHGFGSSAEVFEPQLDYFSKMGYPCFAPDMLGHGLSSAPDRSRDYRFDKLLNDLEVILQRYAFRPGQKCVLVAHNYGCSFATALACKYEKYVHQLVLISGGGPTPLAPPSREGPGHCCLRATLSPLLMCGLHRDIFYSARGRQHPYCGVEPEDQWPSHMRYILEGMIWPDGDYVFHRRISTPTLLIHGLRDDRVSLVQECQMERTLMKAFLEAIPTAGRMPMTDCSDQVNHMIHCFIDLWTKKKR